MKTFTEKELKRLQAAKVERDFKKDDLKSIGSMDVKCSEIISKLFSIEGDADQYYEDGEW